GIWAYPHGLEFPICGTDEYLNAIINLDGSSSTSYQVSVNAPFIETINLLANNLFSGVGGNAGVNIQSLFIINSDLIGNFFHTWPTAIMKTYTPILSLADHKFAVGWEVNHQVAPPPQPQETPTPPNTPSPAIFIKLPNSQTITVSGTGTVYANATNIICPLLGLLIKNNNIPVGCAILTNQDDWLNNGGNLTGGLVLKNAANVPIIHITSDGTEHIRSQLMF
ncbi:MAG: hypothetical protein PHW12_04520, partial [Smithella sp.]|nr:hypothetical protein [Smithella sp.]